MHMRGALRRNTRATHQHSTTRFEHNTYHTHTYCRNITHTNKPVFLWNVLELKNKLVYDCMASTKHTPRITWTSFTQYFPYLQYPSLSFDKLANLIYYLIYLMHHTKDKQRKKRCSIKEPSYGGILWGGCLATRNQIMCWISGIFSTKYYAMPVLINLW